jgi:tRNA(Arg) A34 adenosine deaminase TadA
MPAVDNDKLKEYWCSPVSELVALREPALSDADVQRHRVFSLMLMALVHHYWNGNKKGLKGEYPWNETGDKGPHGDGDYLGHNIAAIAVDAHGRVIDFEFNHNELFNSSAEHAETRLIRRVYAMGQVSDTWIEGDAPARDGGATFADITVYTSLESCSQCAGAMALARVKEVVYLQTDPGMYLIGNILRNLTDDKLRAPRPIAASEIGLPYLAELNDEFSRFKVEVESKPFHVLGKREDRSQSVTSFLCTKVARDIYGRARREFEALPATSDPVREAAQFLRYATENGRRGTPHR